MKHARNVLNLTGTPLVIIACDPYLAYLYSCPTYRQILLINQNIGSVSVRVSLEVHTHFFIYMSGRNKRNKGFTLSFFLLLWPLWFLYLILQSLWVWTGKFLLPCKSFTWAFRVVRVKAFVPCIDLSIWASLGSWTEHFRTKRSYLEVGITRQATSATSHISLTELRVACWTGLYFVSCLIKETFKMQNGGHQGISFTLTLYILN